MILVERCFTSADQIAFAKLSGDINPMHMDAVYARRTQAGVPVVHGIHLLLWGLESYAASRLSRLPILRIKTVFKRFVEVGELVQLVLASESADTACLSLQIAGSVRVQVTLSFGEPLQEEAQPSDSVPLSNNTAPSALDLGEMVGRRGALSLAVTPGLPAEQFPLATQWLGAERIAALAATSKLVGMDCPGLHSIYSELDVCLCTGSIAGRLVYRVESVDERFRLVTMQVAGGGVRGRVKAFVRVPPIAQPTMKSLENVVASGEFREITALIVGGSRGLGELTAKLIAAGGGRVLITWAVGRDDAERVAEEIRSVGGACVTMHYDATGAAEEQLAALPRIPTHLYYFATPHIFGAEEFSFDRLQWFLAVYVKGFSELVAALRRRTPALSVFYPSSVAVEDRPRGMTEYAMAKAAGEILCADLRCASLHITMSRLPRLLTDQTATILPVETASPLDILLPLIRETQSRPR